MTQRERTAKANIKAWENSTMYSVLDAYNTCSSAKVRAWNYCKELCDKYDGYGLKVVSKNSFVFTAGFEFVNKETGECMYMHITPNYDTAVSM